MNGTFSVRYEIYGMFYKYVSQATKENIFCDFILRQFGASIYKRFPTFSSVRFDKTTKQGILGRIGRK